jgi:energy-coupling factor transport system substrate-specific component
MSWQMASFGLVGLVVLGGFAWYERTRPPAKVLALVAALAALAVVGRLAFAPFPNVKPTTDIVLLSGYALGGAPGFCVGALAALVSNFFFGQGPWTPWQMAAWGGVGMGGALLARLARGRELGRVPLALACGVAALGFGAVMDFYQWTLAPEQSLGAYLVVAGRSLPFNAAHVVASVAFCLAIGPPLVGALSRYRRRLEVRWPRTGAAATGGAAGAAPLAALALAAALLGATAPAASAAGTGRALDYLERAQNRDGGFGASPRDSSDQLMTGWAALGLASGGRNPLDVTNGGRSAMDFIRSQAGSLNDTGELSRTIMVVEAAGASARSFGGHNLVADLQRRRQRNGAWDGLVNQTAFGILALKAAGAGGLGKSARWIAQRQNGDGGFGFNAGQSSPDVTGAVLEALGAAGRRGSETVDGALRYLARVQRGNGGFGQLQGQDSNVQSTAWAVQGLVGVGKSPARLRHGGRTPLDYIRGLQAGDGSFRYSGGSSQTPVWVTAQAIPALEREAFPLRPVARERGGGARAGATSGGARLGGGRPSAPGGGGLGGGASLSAGDGAGGSLKSLSQGAGAADPGAGAGSGRDAGGETGGDRRGAGAVSPSEAPPQFDEPEELAAASVDEGESSPGGEGSVLGGLIAAASSAGLVIGLRRRINGRAAAD